MRLEARIKKAETKLFGKRVKLSGEQIKATMERLQRFPPEKLARAIISRSINSSRSIKVDGFLAAFPSDFQEKVKAAIKELNEARDQDQKGGGRANLQGLTSCNRAG